MVAIHEWWGYGLGLPLGLILISITAYFLKLGSTQIQYHNFSHSNELDSVRPRYRFYAYANLLLDCIQYSSLALATDIPFTSHASGYQKSKS